jgi:hypothetical protein
LQVGDAMLFEWEGVSLSFRYCIAQTLCSTLKELISWMPDHISDMQVRVNVPAAPNAMQNIFNEHNFLKASRAVNHLCNFVTTHVAPHGGRAFHEPLRPPCLLNLHGTVHHWLRSAQSMIDITLSMDQWWLSPDTSADEDMKAFVASCRQQLEMCNPVTKKLLRSCELARAAHDHTVVHRFQYSDTGPDVSALYHSNSDRLPPHILLSKWPKDKECLKSSEKQKSAAYKITRLIK